MNYFLNLLHPKTNDLKTQLPSEKSNVKSTFGRLVLLRFLHNLVGLGCLLACWWTITKLTGNGLESLPPEFRQSVEPLLSLLSITFFISMIMNFLKAYHIKVTITAVKNTEFIYDKVFIKEEKV